MGAARLGQGQRFSDDRPDLALGRHLRDLRGDGGHAGALGVAEVHEQQRDVLGQRLADGHRGLRRGALPGADDASAGGYQSHVGGQVHADDELVHQIDALAVGQFKGAGDDVLRLVVDDLVGAEAADEVRLGGAGHGGEHPRAEGLGQLHGGGADAAGRALHEDGLAGLHGAAPHEAVVGGGEDHAQGGRLGERETVGYRHGLGLGQHDVLGIAALAAHAKAAEEDLVARLDTGDLGADRLHDARSVRADDLGRLLGRGEAVLAYRDVHGVHGSSLDAHEDLACLGFGLRDLFVHQDLGTAVLVDTHRFHRRLLAPPRCRLAPRLYPAAAMATRDAALRPAATAAPAAGGRAAPCAPRTTGRGRCRRTRPRRAAGR